MPVLLIHGMPLQQVRDTLWDVGEKGSFDCTELIMGRFVDETEVGRRGIETI